MDRKKVSSLGIIGVIVGFMLAIQFQSVAKPEVRDTRDTWQLREALVKEKELQSTITEEIRANEEKLDQYETQREQSKETTLRTTLEELRMEAGLTEVTGPGLRIEINQLKEELLLGTTGATLSPELLRRLLNELNMYEAQSISVAGQRVINTTVIRDINGETKMNGRSLTQFPLEILVMTKDIATAEKLYNRMQVSNAIEEFFIDNLTVSIGNPQLDVRIPAYTDTIRIRDMEIVENS